MKKKIKSKTDEFLEKAEIIDIEPLHAGTGYSTNQVLKAIPNADPKEVFEMIRSKFHDGIFPESEAIEQVITELKQRSKKK